MDGFLPKIENFREKILAYYEIGLTRQVKKEIERLSFAFATDITKMTGNEHEALVQFCDDRNMIQITVKSKHETFCFVRAGG